MGLDLAFFSHQIPPSGLNSLDLGFYRPDPECGCADRLYAPVLQRSGNLYCDPFSPCWCLLCPRTRSILP